MIEDPFLDARAGAGAGRVGCGVGAGCPRSRRKSQVEFGITVAQRGLWQEAVFRWERATEIDPTYAAAFNNLGIAYEQLGKFEQAGKAYEKALELEPQNLSIQQNYDLFKEINDRAKRNTGTSGS